MREAVERLRGREWWIVAIVVLLLFSPLLAGRTLFFRDLTLLFYPKKLLLLRLLQSGELPLWDPFTHGGQPFLANPQNMTFHPSNAAYLFLPPLVAFNLNIVAHFVFSAWSAWFLATRIGFRGAAAAIVSATYALSGFPLSTGNLMNWQFGWPWVPLTIAALHTGAVRREWRHVAIAALCGAMPIFSGAPELTILMWFLAGVWTIAGSATRDDLSLRCRHLAAAVALSGAIAAAQVVPTLEMIRESSRSPSHVLSSSWSVAPERLPEWIVPRFFGPTDTMSDDAYWGSRKEHNQFPYILSIYGGASVVTLALAGLFTAPVVTRRQRLVLGALVALSFALALGRNLPLLEGIHRLVPPLGFFRFPVKALALSVLPLALLAAAGSEGLAGQRRRALLCIFVAAPLALLVAFRIEPDGFAMTFFGVPASAVLPGMLTASLIHAVVASAAIAGIAYAPALRLAPLLACAVVMIDLVIAGRAVNPHAPAGLLTEPGIVQAVRRAVGEGRFYRDPAEPGTMVAPADRVEWRVWWFLQTLHGYAATSYGIPTLFHADFDGLAPRGMVRVADLVNRTPWPRRTDLLAAAGVQAFLTPAEVDHPRATLVSRFGGADRRPLRLYSIRNAATARFRGPCAAQVSRPHRTSRTMTVEVESGCRGVLTLTDVNYPGWTTYVDGRPAEVAPNEVLTSIDLPPGRHQVRRIYQPRAVTAGLAISAGGLAIAVLLLFAERKAAQAGEQP